jgi:hypothetical protein
MLCPVPSDVELRDLDTHTRPEMGIEVKSSIVLNDGRQAPGVWRREQYRN